MNALFQPTPKFNQEGFNLGNELAKHWGGDFSLVEDTEEISLPASNRAGFSILLNCYGVQPVAVDSNRPLTYVFRWSD